MRDELGKNHCGRTRIGLEDFERQGGISVCFYIVGKLTTIPFRCFPI